METGCRRSWYGARRLSREMELRSLILPLTVSGVLAMLFVLS